MAPTLVNVAVGVLLGLALLGAAFDRRSVAVVAVAAALPDLDAVVSLVVRGATNAAFHALVLPAAAFAVLYWDTRRRGSSRLRERWGRYGVRVAWVSLAAVVVAGIAPELFGPDGANLLYPLHDRFYAVVGRFRISTHEGLILTFVEGGEGLLRLSSPGTTADHHVESWVNPTPGPGLETGADVERRLTLVESGWQLIVVAAAGVALAARLRLETASAARLEDANRTGGDA